MAGVKGIWEATMKIDGEDIPLSKEIIQEITVRSNIHQELPSLAVSIVDNFGKIMNTGLLKDGSKIYLEMGDGSGNVQAMNFICIGGYRDSGNAPSGQITRFQGVLDNIQWMRKIVDKPYEGNSGDVIKQLASQAGLKAIISSTQDKMTWLPNRKPLAHFARMVTDHAWAGEANALLIGVTEKAEVMFKSLTDILSESPQKKFGQSGNSDELPILEYRVDSKALAYNNARGYGSTTIQPQMDGTIKELNKVGTVLLGGLPNIGQIIQSAIGTLGGRVESLPVDCGNAHEKYVDAKHQNYRIKTSFSNDVKVLTDVVSEVDLLKQIEFSPREVTTREILNTVSGAYIATAKVMSIIKGRYHENLVLTSQGPSS